MPNTKSAEKALRVADANRQENRRAKSQVKTSLTKVKKLVDAGSINEAETAAVSAQSNLDKAAEKGIIHPKNAARRKSRLMKKLNQAAK
ncbi:MULTISPECIES: 30S ribosomal protein S20 [Dehalococcoides]|uniref:Small ribosomal subunit protein bS20 n=3 Tax=Dehalococcoides mccartyi TaxID=61435 RepID=RS20_DEHMC|nr:MULTISPECIES: 30S ribosomal protein S20 [Dehalococcoides]A5FPB2.1 RecName: Full=Small ribosomal subunit protein bS20; AltName: Full=30S ribosomal protein S20 [Dehalococcoides mccartyi BAV1]Q3ZZW3.1 RecName: Full=Small ribosomal subunit protein bS20; AltName: Full=30S ribosomal protein S20 [Dehalococcoides mccartyi CBDB1]AGG07110.1 30S ribosomal protein S20 [Dehalococcoides mccartyi DCMB5]AGG08639.1 30S ribosomal protein S20 [Dehalococcoides mccartyi BTF08]AQU06565.1 30S ribosomal protein S2